MFGKNTSLWTCSGVAAYYGLDILCCQTAHSIYIIMDLTQYAATPLHVHNDLFLPNIFNNCTLARAKYKLPVMVTDRNM